MAINRTWRSVSAATYPEHPSPPALLARPGAPQSTRQNTKPAGRPAASAARISRHSLGGEREVAVRRAAEVPYRRVSSEPDVERLSLSLACVVEPFFAPCFVKIPDMLVHGAHDRDAVRIEGAIRDLDALRMLRGDFERHATTSYLPYNLTRFELHSSSILMNLAWKSMCWTLRDPGPVFRGRVLHG